MGKLTVFLIIILALWLLWPRISVWIRKQAMYRFEDMIRRMTGMPSRKEEKRQQKQAQAGGRKQRRGNAKKGETHVRTGEGMAMMRQYAEDVEYTETREYSETVTFDGDTVHTHKEYSESQVTDAEYTIIGK